MRSMRLALFLVGCVLITNRGFSENNTEQDWYDGRGDWTSLEDFEDKTVEVMMVGGRLVSGRLADVTETFVLVDREETQDRVGRDQVHRITYVGTSTRKRNTLRGLSIGLGAVGLVSMLLTQGKNDDFAPWTFTGVAAVAAIGGGLGSTIGYLTSSPESRTIIYESPLPVNDHNER